MKLVDKKGHLTAYAFACGYIETKTNGGFFHGKRADLPEGVEGIQSTIHYRNGCYFVRTVGSGKTGSGEEVRTVLRLKDARKLVNQIHRM